MNVLLPELGVATQALIRVAYGVLMTATLVQALPEARRFFLSERWGGYAKSQRDVDFIQNPLVMPALTANCTSPGKRLSSIHTSAPTAPRAASSGTTFIAL